MFIIYFFFVGRWLQTFNFAANKISILFFLSHLCTYYNFKIYWVILSGPAFVWGLVYSLKSLPTKNSKFQKNILSISFPIQKGDFPGGFQRSRNSHTKNATTVKWFIQSSRRKQIKTELLFLKWTTLEFGRHEPYSHD